MLVTAAAYRKVKHDILPLKIFTYNNFINFWFEVFFFNLGFVAKAATILQCTIVTFHWLIHFSWMSFFCRDTKGTMLNHNFNL